MYDSICYHYTGEENRNQLSCRVFIALPTFAVESEFCTAEGRGQKQRLETKNFEFVPSEKLKGGLMISIRFINWFRRGNNVISGGNVGDNISILFL